MQHSAAPTAFAVGVSLMCLVNTSAHSGMSHSATASGKKWPLKLGQGTDYEIPDAMRIVRNMLRVVGYAINNKIPEGVAGVGSAMRYELSVFKHSALSFQL
jgi:hypothetical protein